MSYLYKKYKIRILEFIMKSLKKGEETFHSLRRVKILVVISFFAFLALFVLMIRLIQDLLADEFAQFDTITSFICSRHV